MKKLFIFFALLNAVFTFVACGEKNNESASNNDGKDECSGSAHCVKIGDLLWSEKADKMNWNNAKKYCENLNEGGLENWRLPDIDELRTLIQNCSGTATGGACKASEKNNCLSGECWTSENCASCSPDSSGKYSKLGDTGWLWSSSTTSDNVVDAWGVNFDSAVCGRKLRKTLTYNFRCVIDTKNKATAKKQTSQNNDAVIVEGLQWSNKTKKKMNQDQALNYCKGLKEDGHNDWRLPDIDELRTLIQNCPGTVTGGKCQVSQKNGCLYKFVPEGSGEKSCYTPKDCASCSPDSTGKRSKLGDTERFWSTSEGPSDFDPLWIVDFKAGRIEGVFLASDAYDGGENPKYHFPVRCVRKLK